MEHVARHAKETRIDLCLSERVFDVYLHDEGYTRTFAMPSSLPYRPQRVDMQMSRGSS